MRLILVLALVGCASCAPKPVTSMEAGCNEDAFEVTLVDAATNIFTPLGNHVLLGHRDYYVVMAVTRDDVLLDPDADEWRDDGPQMSEAFEIGAELHASGITVTDGDVYFRNPIVAYGSLRGDAPKEQRP